MKKDILVVLTISLVFFHNFSYSSPQQNTVQNLKNLCKINDRCCRASLKIVKKNSYLVLDLPDGPTSCPEGTQRNLLKCITSLKWCEPQTNSSKIGH